jgi:Fe-S cluster assembly protein SufD
VFGPDSLTPKTENRKPKTCMTMPETTLQSGFTQEAFDGFMRARNEPDWLQELRQEAWEIFNELPLPERRQEEWMRTDIRGFRLESFGFPVAPDDTAVAPPALLTAGMELAGHAVSLDGGAYRSQLDAHWRRKGVLFGSLDQMVLDHGELLRPHFLSRIIQPGYDKFSALQSACWCGGTLLYVPRGVVIEQPLHILSAIGQGGVDLSRCLVVLEDGAEATLLAETASSDLSAAGLHCGGVELLLGTGSRLRYVNLQDWGTGVWHFAHQKAIVGRDASLQWTIGALGSRLAKVNQHVVLSGEGASAQVNGVMFTDGRQHHSYHTLQHHQAAHCTSDLLYKGALQGNSRIVWRGMIKVDRDAQKTDGYQRDDNLILSESARADSIPGLEIEADDVKCSHGATVGRVDDEQVFYACARGFTRQEAIRTIVTGFFQQVFDRIPIESVSRALGEAIGRRVREFQ